MQEEDVIQKELGQVTGRIDHTEMETERGDVTTAGPGEGAMEGGRRSWRSGRLRKRVQGEGSATEESRVKVKQKIDGKAVCVACYQQERNHKNASEWVQCDECDGWVAVGCVADLPEDYAEREHRWFCRRCASVRRLIKVSEELNE